MRTKEDSDDYRYFPEPDLPPLALPPERLARIRAALPELPDAREARLVGPTYGLGEDDAAALARTPGRPPPTSRRTAQASGDAGGGVPVDARRVEPRRLDGRGPRVDASRVTPQALGALIRMAVVGCRVGVCRQADPGPA